MPSQDILAGIDRDLFYFINRQFAATWMDNVMLLLRNTLTWAPLYLFMVLWFVKYAPKSWVLILILSLVTFAITDYTSASLLKPLIARLRPCHDGSIGFLVTTPAGCGGPFSMPSSHASNHFGLAIFWYLIIRQITEKKWYWLWVWAALVCYAQIYVGVHYPSDIVAGACLGVLTGNISLFLFLKWNELLERRNNMSPVEMMQ